MRVADDTVVLVDGVAVTFGAFCADNEFSPAERAYIIAGLELDGSYVFGGGAAALIEIRIGAAQ